MERSHHEASVSMEQQVLLELEVRKDSEETHVPSEPPRFSCDPCCAFSKQQHSVSDSEQRSKSTLKLCGLTFFYLVVMTVEIVGGLKANSLAILTDAAHLLTDVAGFSISLFTIWATGWQATPHQSFGFNRIEVLGALLSLQLIWVISGYLIFEAFHRIRQRHLEVDGGLMFSIAAFGFAINLIMVMWLGHGHHHDHDHHHGHDHGHVKEVEEESRGLVVPDSIDKNGTMNINIKGAYLHVMADMIQSVGVMIAGLAIWVRPEWLIVDLVCTLVFAVLALATTLPMLRSVFSILMESTPSEVDVVRLGTDLRSVKGVLEVHDLHVWAITVGKIALACHVNVEAGVDSKEILCRVKVLCRRIYGIHHVTVQIEQD